MKWVLFFLITSVTNQFANSTTVPMASEELCNAAKTQLRGEYDKFNSPYYVVVIQCLKSG